MNTTIIKRKRPIVAPVETENIKPKKITDYSQGKIYKISSSNCDEVYIGSTIQSLNDRFSCHKSYCNIKNNSSKIVISKGDSIIELIEHFPCESRAELCIREGEIMKDTLNLCNKQVAGRTHKEYLKKYNAENADKIRKYQAKYRADKLKNIVHIEGVGM